MKLFFVVPGDQIKLLEEVKFIDAGWNKMDIDVIPKDTVLQISQVYIRNKGWYESNLSFKFVSGPGYDLFLKSENDQALKGLVKRFDEFQAEIKDLEDHNADYRFEDHRCNWDKRVWEYKKGTVERYNKFLNSHRGSYSYHKIHLQVMANKAENAVKNFKPRKAIPENFCPVFRVPLPEVEKWNIELLPGRVVKENELVVK